MESQPLINLIESEMRYTQYIITYGRWRLAVTTMGILKLALRIVELLLMLLSTKEDGMRVSSILAFCAFGFVYWLLVLIVAYDMFGFRMDSLGDGNIIVMSSIQLLLTFLLSMMARIVERGTTLFWPIAGLALVPAILDFWLCIVGWFYFHQSHKPETYSPITWHSTNNQLPSINDENSDTKGFLARTWQLRQSTSEGSLQESIESVISSPVDHSLSRKSPTIVGSFSSGKPRSKYFSLANLFYIPYLVKAHTASYSTKRKTRIKHATEPVKRIAHSLPRPLSWIPAYCQSGFHYSHK
jgi:hypothetical protein